MLYAKGGATGNDANLVDYGRLVKRLELVGEGDRWRDDMKRVHVEDKKGRTYEVHSTVYNKASFSDCF